MSEEIPVDAVLLVSFGGPNGPDDVMPFLRNVTRGRNVPDSRLADVAEHYYAVGGRSPINEQNIALLGALRSELAANDMDLPVYWGNRNWDPYLSDVMKEMTEAGHRRVVAFVTSAFSSFSGCRQYRQDIEAATEGIESPPRIEKIRQFFNHPGFVNPMIDNTRKALSALTEDERRNVRLVFTAHSIPMSMALGSRYEAQLSNCSAMIAEAVDADAPWDLVYQSRSGAPHVPWLEPDVNDHLRKLRNDGVSAVVVVPVGFISDHMEVVHDLDDEAATTANEIGLAFQRAKTVGVDPRFVTMIRELVSEHVDTSKQRVALGSLGPVGCLGDTCCMPVAPVV